MCKELLPLPAGWPKNCWVDDEPSDDEPGVGSRRTHNESLMGGPARREHFDLVVDALTGSEVWVVRGR